MYFSATTIAAVATFGFGLIPGQVAAVPTEDQSIAERGLLSNFFGGGNLCDKPNYGAVGKPWDYGSKPGAYCGSKKPSNSGAWAQIPLWDGGDSVKCKSVFSRWGLNICTTGNKKARLPWGCRPPKSKPSKPTKPSTPITSSTSPAPTSTTSVATDDDTATSITDIVPSVTVTDTSAASPSPSSGSDDPYVDPVCNSKYQVQYIDYQVVADHGPWAGQTVGAATTDGSYLTYTLSDTVEGCLKACDGIEGCTFVNTFYDYAPSEADTVPKHKPGVLSCAMFGKCVGTESNTNIGGDSHNMNQVKNSNGYCKSGACGV